MVEGSKMKDSLLSMDEVAMSDRAGRAGHALRLCCFVYCGCSLPYL